MSDKRECTCGQKFRDAEDFRDHLPCEGSPLEKALQRIQAAKEHIRTLEDRLSSPPSGYCGAETTVRDDEHMTYRCGLWKGHLGPHEAHTTVCEWTDAPTQFRQAMTKDEIFLSSIAAYIDEWRNGDAAWHAAGHIRELAGRAYLEKGRCPRCSKQGCPAAQDWHADCPSDHV